MPGTYAVLNGGGGSESGHSLSLSAPFLLLGILPTIITVVGRGGGVAVPRQLNGLGLE